VLHTLLAINFGALLAVFAPTLVAWARLPTTVANVDYGLASWWLTAAAVGVLASSARNALAARRHFGPPEWQRHELRPGRRTHSKRILVTGATGFIGSKLVYRLVERGDRPIVFVRNPAKAADLFGPHAEIVTNLGAIPAATRIDAIVNLAGESIAGGPWTPRRRQLLLDSRLGVTGALLALVGRLAAKPKTWVNASAIGYYGARAGDEPLHEKAPGGHGFQAELCRRCEEAAAHAAADGIKVTTLRTGVVLGGDGGALPALARPVRVFAGTLMGNGRQWFSWIHIDDLLNVVLFALDQETLAGPLNATAPQPVRHVELMAAIAAALNRPLWPVAIPASLLRAVLGELAELFVDGQRVVPARLCALGFEFRYPTIEAALEQALARRADAPQCVSGWP
jgi:hypothetical protein